MNIDTIVNVAISAATGIVTRLGFGIPLIWGTTGKNGQTSGTLLSYTDLDGVLADFANTTPEYLMAAAIFAQNPHPPLIKIGKYTTIDTDYTALKLIDNDFYVVLPTTRTKASLLSLAALVEADKKLMIATTADADVITSATDDIASTLQAAKRTRTALIYSAHDTEYPEACWAGLMLSKDPGSATWKFKQVSGLLPDSLNDSVVTILQGKNCNFYTATSGINMFAEGVVASGQFIDIMQGIDWLQVNLQADVFQALADADKIPYTDAGGDVIRNIISSRLKLAIGSGIIANDPAPVITIPKAADQATNDKAARLWNGVKFVAYTAGAIHKVQINGYLSL